MPASWPLLCTFIGQHRGTCSGNTIKTWFTGIHAWHVVNQAQWYGDDQWVRMCQTAAKRDSTHFHRSLCMPISVQHLLTLGWALDLSNFFHAAVWAVALTCFFRCRRLGEVTIPSAGKFDPMYHATSASSISFPSLPGGDLLLASFHIPWTKTTCEVGASVIVTARPDGICPVKALHIHRHLINKDCPAGMSLFAYHSDAGEWTHMVKLLFLAFCNSVWKVAGLEHILGYSFRIGSTVELLLAGVSPDVVAATGGWTSLVFLLYWQWMEEIILLSTSRAYRKSNIDQLAALFENFCVRHNIPSSSLADVHSLD